MSAPIVLGITIRANGGAQVTGELNQVRGSINGADNAAQNANRSFAAMARETLGLGNALKGLAMGFSALAIYQSTKEIIMLADKMTLLDSRIKIATASQADYVSASKELVAISLRTGTSFESNVTIFSRVNKAMEGMGGSIKNTTSLVETMAQSMRISGTSIEEASSTIRQLSQAMASGLLRGDEFNSVMENAPRLAQAIADGMHVSIGALRAMAEAGELNSKRVITAIQSQTDAVGEEAKKIPLTVGAALENINTAFGQYILTINKGSGATAGLADSLNDLSRNLTPVLDGLITLAKIATAVFAVQLVQSLGAYMAASIAAATAERAHTAAIAQNIAVNIARAESTVIATTSVLSYEAAQLATVKAEASAVTSKLLLVDTSIAQARATIAATSLTMQSTSVLYIQRQAEQSLAIAETERIAILAKLTQLQGYQATVTRRVSEATAAQAAATAGLVTAQEVATFSLTGFIAGLTLAGVAMAALSAATSIFIGLQLASYLNEFVAVQNAGAVAANYLIKTMETLNYVKEKAILLSQGDIAGARQLRVEHEALMASENEITASIIASNNAKENGAALSGEMAAALESLKTPQEVYNQKIRDANEAAKTLDATTGKLQITEEQRLALGIKALEIWRQANAEEQNAKLSDAGKELVKLQAQYDKLAMSPKDYNKQQAQSLIGSPEEKAAVERLNNSILTLQESKKALAQETKEQNSETKKAANEVIKNYESAAKSADDFMQKLKDEASLSSLTATQKQDFAAEQIAQKMEDANISSQLQAEFLTQAHEQIVVNEALSKSRKIDEVILSGMAALKDKYDQLTLSASAYYAKTLENQHLSPEQAAPLMEQFDKNTGAEAAKKATEDAKKSTDDARQALEAYNQSLDDAHVKTSDLGAVTSAIFDGALGGISTLTGAFINMSNAINANAIAMDALIKKQAEINSFQPDASKGITDQYLKDVKTKYQASAKNTQAIADLEYKALQDQLSGMRQAAGAASKMFKDKSAAAQGFAAVEKTIGIAQMAMSVIQTAKSLAAGAAKMFEMLGPWGFAAVAAMVGVVAAVSGESIQAPPAYSPDTGTVLGDSTAKSESIDKTFQLLKDIHASEYAELRGINAGINSLVSGITGTITAVFQGGGLITRAVSSSASALGFSSKNQSVTASGINTGAISVADAMRGGQVSGNQFDTVKTDKSSWWGLSKSTTYDTYYTALDAKVTSSISLVFKSMGEVMTDAAKLLGGNLQQKVRDYIIPAMNIDLNGLSGEDAAKKLNGVISAALDTMATTVFGNIIGQYQKLGEGMLETAIRIVSEVAVVKDALATSGLSLASNAIAISDALVQAAGGLAEFQKQFQSYFDKFYTNNEKQSASYTSLSAALLTVLEAFPQTRDGYRKLVEGLDLTNALDQQRYILLMSLSAAADTYYTALDAQTKTYTDAIATAKSNLATAYKTESDAITATISKLSSFVASLKTLKDSLALGNLSPGTPLDKYKEARRQATAAYNTIQGGAGTTTASKAAYDAAAGSINAKLTTFLDASKTYNASGSAYTADYNDVMTGIDTLSLTATSQQTDAEKQLEQLTKSVGSLVTINTSVLSVKDALAGVTAAIGASQVLQTDRDKVAAAAQQAVAQSGIDRAAADKAATEAAARAADLSTSRAEVTRLVAAYQAHPSASGSEAVNSYLRSIAGRFNESYNLDPGVSAEGMWTLTPKFAKGGAHAGGWRIVGEHGPELEHTGPSRIFSNSQSTSMLGGGNSQEIILELRALRAEVAKLRAEQRDNTGALIQSNYDANDQAAEKVVTGTKDTAKQTAWANNSKAVIA